MNQPDKQYIDALKRALVLYGYNLADTETVVLVGRDGNISVPAQAIVSFTYENNDWQPNMRPCVQKQDGSWWTTDGVRAVERVA